MNGPSAHGGDINMVKLLIKDGENVNEKFSDYKYTPLMLAAKSGNLETVKYLVQSGADVHATTHRTTNCSYSHGVLREYTRQGENIYYNFVLLL